MYVWYHNEYVRITVIHNDFAKTTKRSFWKIKMCRHSMIQNLVIEFVFSYMKEKCINTKN